MSPMLQVEGAGDLVRRIADAVRSAVAGAHADEPVVAVGLFEGDEPWPALMATVALASDRERHLRAGDSTDVVHAAWNPSLYDIQVELDAALVAETDVQVYRALERIADAATDGAWVSASAWVLREVCRDVSHRPPPGVRFGDFVCFVEDPGIGDDLMASIAYAVPAATWAELAHLGLVWSPGTDHG